MQRGQRLRLHPALTIDRHLDDALTSQADHHQGFEDADVDFLTHDHPNGWGTE